MNQKLRIHVQPDNQPKRYLEFGGSNPHDISIMVNQRYLELDGEPWLPVMGEFHFSRYPSDRWRDELLKMKAGGISIIATYIFWIHIEESKGTFTWEGNKNLRRFIELCQELGLFAYPRIGPWAHGECRNGGFPDWLLQECGKNVRQDAQPYLSYVRIFYQSIFQQVKGLLWKDGGPIIGIQLENELTNNPDHILTLKRIAQEIGFEVPLYTMTGWGPAQIPTSGVIPVFGGYPDAFWDRQVLDWSSSSAKHYFFTPIRDDNTIGADINPKPDAGRLAHLYEFPYGTCEIGGGMQFSYHRRPLILPDDVAALAQVKIGNGSNLQGYYMYHGGSNPTGMFTSMQESQATGYPNDLPVIDYDFQAPLGEYGQVRDSFHKLRLLHIFLQHFGKELATYPPIFPELQPASLIDRETLRWSVRSNGQKGFLFINNYQRMDELPEHPGIQFQVELDNETLTLPTGPVTIPKGAYLIWPMNLELGEVTLKFATVQPVCSMIVDGNPTYIFASEQGIPTEFVFDAGTLDQTENTNFMEVSGTTATIKLEERLQNNPQSFSVFSVSGARVTLIILPREEALQLYKIQIHQKDYIILTNGCIFVDNSQVHWQAAGEKAAEITIYPDPPASFFTAGHSIEKRTENNFSHFHIGLEQIDLPIGVELVKEASRDRIVPIGPAGVAQAPEEIDFNQAAEYRISFPNFRVPNSVKEIILEINYVGDAARMYLGNRLIEDDFYSGRTWEIGLTRFQPDLLAKGIVLKILPLPKNAPIYLDESALPDFTSQNPIARLDSIRMKPIWDIGFNF